MEWWELWELAARNQAVQESNLKRAASALLTASVSSLLPPAVLVHAKSAVSEEEISTATLFDYLLLTLQVDYKTDRLHSSPLRRQLMVHIIMTRKDLEKECYLAYFKLQI